MLLCGYCLLLIVGLVLVLGVDLFSVGGVFKWFGIWWFLGFGGLCGLC